MSAREKEREKERKEKERRKEKEHFKGPGVRSSFSFVLSKSAGYFTSCIEPRALFILRRPALLFFLLGVLKK